MALTAKQVEAAKPNERDYKLSDASGLYLLVKKSGGKYWCLKYRFAGKEKKLSIGVYPDISLAQARFERDTARRLLMEGKDPSQEKQNKKKEEKVRNAETFESIAEEWFIHQAPKWSDRHYRENKARIKNHVYPAIGSRPITDIKPMEMLSCLRTIEKAGTLQTLRKTRQTCIRIFAYAIVTGRATSNPADYLDTVLLSPIPTNHRSLAVEKIPNLINDMINNHKNPIMSLATRILMLTALRSHELRFVKRDEVDTKNALLEIPASRMKKRRPHVVPLSRQALNLINALSELTKDRKSSYLIPGCNNPQKVRNRKCFNKFLQQIGWHEYITAHGFRHIFSTIANDNGFHTDWIELQLAHADKNSIRGTYNHALYLDGRREMMQWYADYIDQLISSSTGNS
ncbi:tyrosine-type recombinase/integrase [Salmonella enterica]|nr:DUF4102 domain-containing protein [Salmonella enterica]EEH5171433.1 integrase arm-type DNA-binding domain-containing protein [Salmonella enterica]EHB2434908.1 integrase arm-type DNA-binding domain-containing protein [Salmonella enterica]